MNSIINLLRYIPGVSCLENIASRAFGRVWSLLAPEETKVTPKIFPVNFGFGCPETDRWVAKSPFKCEKPLPRLDSSVKPNGGIRISRSPEQEETRISELRVVELTEQLSVLLSKSHLDPIEYKTAWRLLIDLESENDEQNSPTISENIKTFNTRLREFKKT